MERGTARRESRVTLVWAVVGAVAILASTYLLKNYEMVAPVRVALAFLPVPPLLVMLRAMARYHAHCDELQRRMLLEGLAFGFVGSVLAVQVGALLVLGDFFPNRYWDEAAAVMILIWFVGYGVAWLRYR